MSEPEHDGHGGNESISGEVEETDNNQENTSIEEEVVEDKTSESESVRNQMSVEDQETCQSSEEDEDSIVISKQDLMNLQVFRNICFNIKENLEAIKSSKKV